MNDATTPIVRRLAITLAVLTAASIAVAAFVLSFSALWDVATRVWPNRHLSWLGPAVVDSTILQATVSLLVVANGARTGERRYFWSLLIGAAATSIAGNALHAVTPPDRALAPVVAALIACIPPIFLCLSTHSVILLTRRQSALNPVSTPALAGGPLDDHAPPAPSGDRQGDLIGVSIGEHAAHARLLRERYGLTTGVSQIAAVLHRRAKRPGASLRELAVAGNIHHNTAKKIVEAAEAADLATTTESAPLAV